MKFLEIADGKWIPVSAVVRVDDTNSGCDVYVTDGEIYRLKIEAKLFISHIGGSLLGGVE